MDENQLADLLVRLRAGDSEAASTLVRHYEPELRRYIRFRMADHRLRRFLDSMDVSQSVFARFFVGFAEGKIEIAHPRQLFKLLFTMASNKLRDKVKFCLAHKREHRLAQGDAAELLNAVAEDVPDPATQVADEELVQLFRHRLAEDERSLLDGRMEGRSWAELAEESCFAAAPSAEALRKKLARAIDRAARELDLVTGE